MNKYEGKMLYPYAEDLSMAYLDKHWPEALIFADSQLSDVLDGRREVRFIETNNHHPAPKRALRCVWHDPNRVARQPGWTIPSWQARWVPKHRVWVRCTRSVSQTPKWVKVQTPFGVTEMADVNES
jgi:hypothetical protein